MVTKKITKEIKHTLQKPWVRRKTPPLKLPWNSNNASQCQQEPWRRYNAHTNYFAIFLSFFLCQRYREDFSFKVMESW